VTTNTPKSTPQFGDCTEQKRLNDAREAGIPWKQWGPYLSERQWGTVREDDSQDGNAWDDFTHDQSRARAYRWGEDGLGGISDDHQRLCFALALWNGRDPILKERMFGLTNSQGNHGEDVKEYDFYVDSTPTSGPATRRAGRASSRASSTSSRGRRRRTRCKPPRSGSRPGWSASR
jgi:hypothetical protein